MSWFFSLFLFRYFNILVAVLCASLVWWSKWWIYIRLFVMAFTFKCATGLVYFAFPCARDWNFNECTTRERGNTSEGNGLSHVHASNAEGFHIILNDSNTISMFWHRLKKRVEYIWIDIQVHLHNSLVLFFSLSWRFSFSQYCHHDSMWCDINNGIVLRSKRIFCHNSQLASKFSNVAEKNHTESNENCMINEILGNFFLAIFSCFFYFGINEQAGMQISTVQCRQYLA